MINADKNIRTKRKTVALSVDNEGRVIVRAPLDCSEKRIREALLDSEKWLEKQLKKYEESRLIREIYGIRNGGKIPLLGEDFETVFSPVSSAKVEGRTIFLSEKNPEEQLKKLYRKIALNYFTERTEYFSSLTGFVPSSVKVTSAKTRWGSCTSKRNINYSLFLVMCPLDIIDYVIVHELCHIKHPDHSRLFWNEVEKTVPDYKRRRKWLKDNRYIMDLI
ncbi:MAG: M48 family metallopeptidase [Clostridia bacterium]|nr:M48 family metallopeptidase [Clostridia bacterium]